MLRGKAYAIKVDTPHKTYGAVVEFANNGGLCAPSHTVRSAIWMSGMGGRGRTQKRRCQRASVYRCPQPHRANERQPRHIHWSISSRQRRVNAYRSPQPNDRCRRQPDSFGRSTSFTFHDTGANLGCQRERAIQPVRHRQIQSGDERDHQGYGTGCSEKAALEYLVYVHLPIEKTIERTKVRFRRMMDVLKSGGKPSLRVDVHDGRGEMTADIGVSQVKRFMKDNRLTETQKPRRTRFFRSLKPSFFCVRINCDRIGERMP